MHSESVQQIARINIINKDGTTSAAGGIKAVLIMDFDPAETGVGVFGMKTSISGV